ncbi:ornithine carbamoyltransferase [Variovorax boronicumulans]|uniref:ornithine carbamoyltransferase n=1 Tax=Variovorax boronicumulans TaxID=436515 RepID=UPI002787D0C5|nr:ornithine carbamoyltransferase [Variovorax boronicumulans]MDQ0072324.1 ornithine carbamoyltransferase [Variovorax boronicumulans]
MNLVSLSECTPDDVRAIWRLAGAPDVKLDGHVAWSFEGNGIRTRTTFLRAFRDLGLAFIELPNLLKTAERTCDLAGYLDPFYDIYVVRDSDHARLQEFAAASGRPVVNAMSAEGHPCEVLTDAYFIDTTLMPIERARVCLWGPMTNVFRSWHELSRVLGFSLQHVCGAPFQEADIVITDSWPSGGEAACRSLTEDDLAAMGHPVLLSTPPFSVGRELAFDPVHHARFAGYEQKMLLLPVQKAILRYLLGA